MLPISAILIVHNEERYIKRCLTSLPDVQEIILIDQSSTDKTVEIARSLKKNLKVATRRHIGNADPMRNFAYGLSSQPWILAIDGDEYLSPKTKEIISKLILLPTDIFWFPFKNLINKKNVKKILGEDYHPRLFKKGAIEWHSTLHTYPTLKSNLEYWLSPSYPFIHDRSWEDIKSSHKARKNLTDPRTRQMEFKFLQSVVNYLGIKDNLEWF